MKKTLLKGIMAAALVASMASCSESDEPGVGKGAGKISPAVEIDAAVASSRQSRIEANEVGVNDLSVKLTSADGSYSHTWASVADFPVDQPFAVGAYTFEVSYGDELKEGFECPYFYGSQSIRVEENKTTPVAVTATLASSMVSINYSDNFKNYMTSWGAQLHSAGGTYVDYVQDEARPAYVKPGQVEIFVEYTKPNGNNAKVKAATFAAAAKTHYHVNIDLSEGTGTAFLKITFDESTEEEPIVIELNDELENAPEPTIEAEGFDSANAIDFVAGFSDATVKLNIIARGKLGEVKMTTVSKSLLAQGWPAEIDLMQADAAAQQKLESLGFSARGLFKNPDKMAVVDLSAVLNHIAALDGNNTSTFTFSVIDSNGKVCKEPLTVTVNAIKAVLELSNPTKLAWDATSLSFDMECNNSAAAKLAQIEYYNNRGTWTKLETTISNLGNNKYSVTATLPDAYGDVRLRASIGHLVSNELTVVRESFVATASVDNLDVYATHAFVSATIQPVNGATVDADAALAACNVKVSTDGTTYRHATAEYLPALKQFKISELKDNTKYIVKIGYGNFDLASTPGADFTTEEAAQIPNGNLDAKVEINGSAKNGTWTNYAFEGWGTNNAMTTSSGIDANYTRISGTIPTDDAHSGQAVAIRTVGWGSGNTNAGQISIIYKIDAGLLHLGATRTARPNGYGNREGSLNTDDLDCGIKFESRPSALSFWYKYVAKNSADKGQAYIYIKDAQGNIIATATTDLEAVASYTKVTMDLPYIVKAKAASIYVRFMSTTNPNAVKRDFKWINSSAPFLGSQLFIDDIELTY